MGGIISYQTLSPFQGWGFYCAIFPGRCPGLSYFAPSGQMQAYRKDSQVPELVEGALTKPQIYTVAHASGSERSVLFPWLFLLLLFRGSASVFSVFFRVNPWQILLLLLCLPSVANAYS
jgi:hypothetical protein